MANYRRERDEEKTDAPVMKTKEVPDYKQVYERMKQDPEIGFLMRTEGYQKAELIVLYQILEELRELRKK